MHLIDQTCLLGQEIGNYWIERHWYGHADWLSCEFQLGVQQTLSNFLQTVSAKKSIQNDS
jgi:hypothetical protein